MRLEELFEKAQALLRVSEDCLPGEWAEWFAEVMAKHTVATLLCSAML